MYRIENQKHSKETFYYSLSRMLERASYYGLRALVVLYMIGETLKMEQDAAFTIYGWLLSALMFSKIIGGVLGDLLLGNRKTIIIGGILQAIGAFGLCIPSTTGLYIGLFFVVLGNGFIEPNIISNFGKLYLNKTKLLDAGFALLYLVVNLGSFLGILLIGYSGEEWGYTIGFVISGILMLLSILPVLFIKESSSNKITKSNLTISKRVLTIAITFIVVGLFWGIYEISNIRFFNLQVKLSEISSLEIPKHLWTAMNAILILPISLIAIVLWTYFYSNQFFKLMLGFIFGLISFGILLLVPEVPTDENTTIFLLSFFFLSIAEIHIAPILHSVLTKYSNPKYLAIIISLAFLPSRLITMVFGLFNDKFYENPILGLKFGIIAMTIIAAGLLIYLSVYKVKKSSK